MILDEKGRPFPSPKAPDESAEFFGLRREMEDAERRLAGQVLSFGARIYDDRGNVAWKEKPREEHADGLAAWLP